MRYRCILFRCRLIDLSHQVRKVLNSCADVGGELEPLPRVHAQARTVLEAAPGRSRAMEIGAFRKVSTQDIDATSFERSVTGERFKQNHSQ